LIFGESEIVPEAIPVNAGLPLNIRQLASAFGCVFWADVVSLLALHIGNVA